MTMPLDRVTELRASVEAARETTAAAKIAAAEARAIANTAPKAEKVAAARAAAEAKQIATDSAADLRRLEKLLAAAERDADKAAKAALAAASAVQDVEEPAEEIDWARLAEEFVPVARETVACVDGAWGAFDGSRWDFSANRGPALARRVASGFFRFRPGAEGIALRKLGNGPETLLRFAQLELTRDAGEFNHRARTAHLFNVANGTLDLRTGKLRKPRASDLLTFWTDIKLNPKADAARIQAAFALNLGGDLEQLACLQRTTGYMMTGERREKTATFLLGNEKKRGENGDNGKTVFMESVRRVLGNAAGGIKPSLITDNGHKRGASEHDGGLVPLARVRAAIGAEFGRSDVMDEDTFKRITGGDTIQARGVGAAESINFICVAKLVFTTNYLPLIPSRDAAMIGRILPFPFFVRFRKHAGEPGDGPVANPALVDWLETDAGKEAMLLWMAQGAKAWYQQGINPPASLIALRDAHMARHDTWAPFVTDYLVEDDEGEISVAALKVLAEEFRGAPFRSQAEEGAFLRDLEGRGAETFHRGGRAYRRGFCLSDLSARVLAERDLGKLVPAQVVRLETYEIKEPYKTAPVRVQRGDLMGAWLEFVQANEAKLVANGADTEWLTVPGWGQMRRVR